METYNGWANYETWNVALWSSNDEGAYNHVRSNRPYNPVKAQRIALEMFPDGTPDMDSAADMDRVEWSEISKAWNEE